MSINLYVSLTTTPSNIDKLENFFNNLNDQILMPTKILLIICEKYDRDTTELIIPEFIKNNKNIQLIKSSKDYGPLTKLYPAIKYLKVKQKLTENLNDKYYIITIDDDIKYPSKLFYYLVFNMKFNEYSPNVSKNISPSIRQMSYGFSGVILGLLDDSYTVQCKHIKTVNILAGYGGVIYNLDMFKDDFDEYIEKTTMSNLECKLS